MRNRWAYDLGSTDAMRKFAGAQDVFKSILKSPNLRRNLNIAGLGLIAAPVAHSVLSHGEDSPTTEKLKHLSDLSGLGLLVGTEFMKH